MGAEVAWTTILSTVANIGFSALVGWFLLTKAIPEMQKAFLETLERQRQHFDTTLAALKAEHREAMQMLITHSERETLRRDETLKSSMDLVTMSLRDHGEVIEELRDVLKIINYKIGVSEAEAEDRARKTRTQRPTQDK